MIMWISLFEMKKDLVRLEETFATSRFKQSLEKYGEVSFKRSGTGFSHFNFTIDDRDITFYFSYFFKEREISFYFDENPIPSYIHQTIVSEFTHWLTSIGIDCFLITMDHNFFSDGNYFTEQYAGRTKYFSHTGPESKQLVTLMQQIPIRYNTAKHEHFYIIDRPSLLDNAELIASFSFYPTPCVDIIVGLSETRYNPEILQSFVFKRCTTTEDIQTFFTWNREMFAKKEEALRQLHHRLSSYEGITCVQESFGYLEIKGKPHIRYGITLSFEDLEFKYRAKNRLDDRCFSSLNEALDYTAWVFEKEIAFITFQQELLSFLSSYGDSEHRNREKEFRLSMTLFGQPITIICDYFMDDEKDELVYRYVLNHQKHLFATASAMQQALLKEITHFIHLHRVRSIVEIKQEKVD